MTPISTGQGTTWVLVADGRHAPGARGRGPRAASAAPQYGRAAARGGRSSPARARLDARPDPHTEHERQRFVHALVQVLEHGAAENRFRNLVLVAEPHMLGLLRDSLPRGLADRSRKSIAKDWTHLPDAELAEQVRPLVEIWPR